MGIRINKLVAILLALMVLCAGMSSFATGIDYDSLSLDELKQIIKDADDAIERNHRVSSSDSSYLEAKIKSLLVSRKHKAVIT